VIKIGSSLLCENRKPNLGFFEEVVGQVASLIKQDYEVVIVSSGAIASGMSMLGLNVRPLGAAGQAAAAIGQPRLMDLYKEYFKEHKINCAQVLLTWDDFDDRKRYLNAKNTLLKLLEFKAIPIVNENDTVATDEIGFGDNDRLSALVARLVGADVLIILSDVDGLLNKDRNLIPFVENITLEIKALACPTNNKTCVGGMVTKIEAAKIATDAGIACVISNGRKKDIIASVLTEPEKNGTLFYPKSGMSARKHWIAFSVKPKGRIIVDDGAKEALLKNKRAFFP
jgi:glutamate 5-kinase